MTAAAKPEPACGECGWCRVPLPDLVEGSTGICAACLKRHFGIDLTDEETTP